MIQWRLTTRGAHAKTIFGHSASPGSFALWNGAPLWHRESNTSGEETNDPQISCRKVGCARGRPGCGHCRGATAYADDYPSHPIIMGVPLAPGGSTDVLARITAQGMSKQLGEPVVVENTSGAGGTIGVTKAERAAPDGYTILFGQWGTNMANGAIYSLDFDLVKDFEPIALVATQPFMIDARKGVPANNLKELIAWLKESGDKATEGNSGVGS